MNPVRGLLRFTPARCRPGVKLVVRTLRDARDDRVPGLAAELAFYLMLSLPPLLLTVLGSLGYTGEVLGVSVAESVRARMLSIADTVFSADTTEFVRALIDTLLAEGRADIVSLGTLLTLWSASRALNVVMGAITIAYDLEARRRVTWRRRLLALAGTVGVVIGGLLLAVLLVSGPQLGERLVEPLGLDQVFGTVWRVAYWPVVALVGVAGLALLYHLGAPWSTPWRRDLPGAALAVGLWLAGSGALRLYTATTIERDAVYAQVAAPLAVLLWLYVTGFAVLLGAELNAEIERMWPARPSAHQT